MYNLYTEPKVSLDEVGATISRSPMKCVFIHNYGCYTKLHYFSKLVSQIRRCINIFGEGENAGNQKCDYNSYTIKACIRPYNSSEKRQKKHILFKHGCPHQHNQIWCRSHMFLYFEKALGL